MVEKSAKNILKINEIQEHGLVSPTAIKETEIKLAKKLKRDLKAELTEKELQEMQEKRSEEIYQIRKRLQKLASFKTKTKDFAKLELESIQKMRAYEKELRIQIDKISNSLKDTHKLIQFEQDHVTHDIASAITFLSHFIHILEINLSNGELTQYLPQHYQLKLLLLLEEAIEHLAEIESATEQVIQNELIIHETVIHRANQKTNNPRTLAELIEKRAEANKQLYAKIDHLKSILHDIHQTLIAAAALAKGEPFGIFLPELASIATHASVNLELLDDTLSTAILSWPPTQELQQTIHKEAAQCYSQLHDLKVHMHERMNHHKKKTHKVAKGLHKSHASTQSIKHAKEIESVIEAQNEHLTTPLNKALRLTLKMAKLTSKSKPLQEDQEMLQEAIATFLHKVKNPLCENVLTLRQELPHAIQTKEEVKHKEEVFEKFTRAIKFFESNLSYFYKQVHARLKNTTDIIHSSITIQHSLSTTLDELQKHLMEFYTQLEKIHDQIISNEKSTYKQDLHDHFLQEMNQKEQEFQAERKQLEEEMGLKIKQLIAEIPKSIISDQNHAAANQRELQKHAAILYQSFKELGKTLGIQVS